MLNAKIIKKTGFGVQNSVYFQAEGHKEITQEQARVAQAELGYIPAGYGFKDFKVEKCPILLRYKATWRCDASCD